MVMVFRSHTSIALRRTFLLLAVSLCAQAKLKELPRESVAELSLSDFQRRYVKAWKPVILRHPNSSQWRAVREWGEAYFLEKCPSDKSVPVQYYRDALEFGGFDPEEADKKSFKQLFESWAQNANTSQVQAYGFDFNAKCHCPLLFDDFEVLKYFLADELIVNPIGQSATFPSLMMGPAGTKSGMHTDKYFLPFWLSLLQGRKRVRVITYSDWNRHLTEWFGDQMLGNMVRVVDIFNDSFLEQTPSFQKVTVWTGDLLPGDTVYIPTAAGHAALNLESPDLAPATAITSNFMDAHHKDQVAKSYCSLELPPRMAADDTCLTASRTVDGPKVKPVTDEPASKGYVSHYMSQTFCELHSRGRFGWTCPLLAKKCDDVGFKKLAVKSCPDEVDEQQASVFNSMDANEDGIVTWPEISLSMAKRHIDHRAQQSWKKVVYPELKQAVLQAKGQFEQKDMDGDGQVTCREFAGMAESSGSAPKRRKRRKKKSSEL